MAGAASDWIDHMSIAGTSDGSEGIQEQRSGDVPFFLKDEFVPSSGEDKVELGLSVGLFLMHRGRRCWIYFEACLWIEGGRLPVGQAINMRLWPSCVHWKLTWGLDGTMSHKCMRQGSVCGFLESAMA